VTLTTHPVWCEGQEWVRVIGLSSLPLTVCMASRGTALRLSIHLTACKSRKLNRFSLNLTLASFTKIWRHIK
jgi:hypothetical protein